MDEGGREVEALVVFLRDALADHFGADNVSDSLPDDYIPADGSEVLGRFTVALDDQSAACALLRDAADYRVDVASDDDALRRRLRKLLERAPERI